MNERLREVGEGQIKHELTNQQMHDLYTDIDRRRAFNRSVQASLVKGLWSRTARGQVRSMVVRNNNIVAEHKIMLADKFA